MRDTHMKRNDDSARRSDEAVAKRTFKRMIV